MKRLDKLKGKVLTTEEQSKIARGQGKANTNVTKWTPAPVHLKSLKFLKQNYLEKHGYHPHDLKRQWVGKGNISKFDIHSNTKTGELVLVSIKDKSIPPIHSDPNTEIDIDMYIV